MSHLIDAVPSSHAISLIESTIEEVLTQPGIQDYLMTRLLPLLDFKWIGTFESETMTSEEIQGAIGPIFHARTPAGFIVDQGGYIYLRPESELLVFHPDPNIVTFFQSQVPHLHVHDYTTPCRHLCRVAALLFIYSWALWGDVSTNPVDVKKFLLSLLETFPKHLTYRVTMQLVASYRWADVPVEQILSRAYGQEGVNLIRSPDLF